jgi:hypothetical protein
MMVFASIALRSHHRCVVALKEVSRTLFESDVFPSQKYRNWRELFTRESRAFETVSIHRLGKVLFSFASGHGEIIVIPHLLHLPTSKASTKAPLSTFTKEALSI